MSELPRKPKTVLLVDDEPYHLEWVVEFLKATGYQVEFATKVEVALEHLQKHRFRTVIVDLTIPKGGAELPRAATDPVYKKYPGLTVAEYARQRGHLGRQVILYSVHDDDAVRAEAARLGATYLMKGRPRQFKLELEDVLSFDPLAQR